jgi:hypothetical protein
MSSEDETKNRDELNNRDKEENQQKTNGEIGSTFDTNSSLKPIEWTVENEMILVEWCDIAQ